MLSNKRKNEIILKAIEIDDFLAKKLKNKADGLTFGGKVKALKNTNTLIINSLWLIIHIRNNLVHSGDIKIDNQEYKLFMAQYEYIMERKRLIKV